MNFILAYYKNL